jgi:hypothetical protein
MIVWAAKPPGSLDFTYFLRFVVSSSAGGAAEASATREGAVAVTRESENGFGLGKERLFGLWEIWEENEREERDEVREDKEIDIFVVLSLKISLRKSEL